MSVCNQCGEQLYAYLPHTCRLAKESVSQWQIFPPQIISSQPYRCPVCEGRGTMPCNFYTRATMAGDTAQVQCKSCNGTGIIR